MRWSGTDLAFLGAIPETPDFHRHEKILSEQLALYRAPLPVFIPVECYQHFIHQDFALVIEGLLQIVDAQACSTSW